MNKTPRINNNKTTPRSKTTPKNTPRKTPQIPQKRLQAGKIEKIKGEKSNVDNSVIEKDKQKFLDGKKIVVNKATDNNDNVSLMTSMPIKIDKSYTEPVLSSVVVDHSVQFIKELLSDNTQFALSTNVYINILLDEVQALYLQTEDENSEDNKLFGLLKTAQIHKGKGDMNDFRKNSLGIVIEENRGIFLSLVRGTFGKSYNKKDHMVIKKNYMNLEEVISGLMESEERFDVKNYLKLAKLNRIKVLIEISLKIVDRSYIEISTQERNSLESDLNRYYTTYPMPGEETLLEETDTDNDDDFRMPLKIINEEGVAKIDINETYIIDPFKFLVTYLAKMFDYLEYISGVEMDIVSVSVPSTHGVSQRETLKNIFKKSAGKNCEIKIVTRPLASSVIISNQRDKVSALISTSFGDIRKATSEAAENYKLLFDMTENSIDASVIQINDKKEFRVISNVSSTTFGLHDLNERIVQYIIEQKAQRSKRYKKKEVSCDIETINAYAELIKNIKEDIVYHNAVNVDLNLFDEPGDVNESIQSAKGSELYIDKSLLIKKICRDLYDWTSAHIEKAMIKADISDQDIDETIIIGEEKKVPGFKEYLKKAYPERDITFVEESKLAIGTAIFGGRLKTEQITTSEILCRSIGIGLYTGVITFLLFRNSPLPCVGGCVYSTKTDDQESILLDLYEGERPNARFCRYIGEITVMNLPRGRAGDVQCEIHLKVNSEGLLKVAAKDLVSGQYYDTILDSRPEHFISGFINNEIELDPIEAERFKKMDYELVYDLEKLDDHLDELSDQYANHGFSGVILNKIAETKVWIYDNRRRMTSKLCWDIRDSIKKFLTSYTS